MPLKKESIIAMATALKIDPAVLKIAMDAPDDQEVKLPEGIKVLTAEDLKTTTVLTAAELTSRDEQSRTAGEKIGRELTVKSLKETAGLEYDGEGSKDPKRFITEYGKKVLKDSNIQESDKVKELNTVIDGLRTNITTLTTEKDGMVKSTKEAQLDNDILTWTIEKKPDNLTNKEWITILKLGNEVTEQDGQLVVKRDGKIVANKTDLKPVPAKDALVGYIDERKLGKVVTTVTPGRNGQDSKIATLGIGNMKQFNQHLADSGVNPNGQQAQQMLKEVVEANPNFDFKAEAKTA